MATQRLAIAALLLAVVIASSAAWAQDAKLAALVIRFGEERVETYCVAFEEETISGYALLERAGLTVDAQEVGMGASVCRVDDVGCESSNCFCQCRGGDCQYWSYWQVSDDGAWQYSMAGASISPVAAGDIQGWSWGPGSVREAIAPPVTSFEEVCQGQVAGEELLNGAASAVVEIAPAAEGGAPATTAAPPQGSNEEASGGAALATDGGYAPALGFGLLLLGLLALGAFASQKKQR